MNNNQNALDQPEYWGLPVLRLVFILFLLIAESLSSYFFAFFLP